MEYALPLTFVVSLLTCFIFADRRVVAIPAYAVAAWCAVMITVVAFQ